MILKLAKTEELPDFCRQLKEEMDPSKMLQREQELLKIAFDEFNKMPSVHILAREFEERLGVISFYVEDIHYNLMVKLLNDRFGIQVRGGCSCAGTYGHYLLHVDPTRSKRITDKINQGDLSEKPGWVRLSLHPTMIDDELKIIMHAINQVIENVTEWEKDYEYSSKTNEFYHKSNIDLHPTVEKWFRLQSN